MVDHSRLGLELGRFLVAIGAWHRNVAAGKHEARLLVPGQAEGGWPVSLQIVAAIAGIEVWCRGKLPGMFVGVTVGAALELDPEERLFSFGNVALGALQARMTALQWIRAQSMLFHGERGGLPAVHRVARGTFSAVGTLRKLAAVRIGSVAIHALLEHEGLLEIAISVALGAIDAGMLALQGELCLGVIKALIQRLSGDLFPSARVMARLAGLRGEAAAMGVFVAVGALVEWNPGVLRLAIRSVGVALGALHLGMQPRERVACFRVIELCNADFLPVFEIVALLTGRAQPSFVGILVTAATCGREAEISSAQILDFDGRTVGGRDIGSIVALVTGQAGVLAFEGVPSFLVIEGLDIPLDQREVLAIVLRVAARAFLTGTGGNVVSSVQAFVGGEPSCDLGMAIEALEGRLPPEFVATGAVGSAVERLVRPRQWPGRNLGRGGRHRRKTQQEENGKPSRIRRTQPKSLKPPGGIRWRGSVSCFRFYLVAHHVPREKPARKYTDRLFAV